MTQRTESAKLRGQPARQKTLRGLARAEGIDKAPQTRKRLGGGAAVVVVFSLALMWAGTGISPSHGAPDEQSSLFDRDVSREITINAAAADVWQVLTDFAAYPAWNPFITNIIGRLAVGERLRVTIDTPTLPPITLQPIVHAFEEGRRYSWLGHLYVPGLFDGLHSFEVVPLGAETVRFVQRERFTGWLVPASGLILNDTERGFALMNQALKERVEGAAGG